MRTRAEVEADMDETRMRLFANDENAQTVEQHAEGDILFAHYRDLADEYAHTPLLPSSRDGHTSPKAV